MNRRSTSDGKGARGAGETDVGRGARRRPNPLVSLLTLSLLAGGAGGCGHRDQAAPDKDVAGAASGTAMGGGVSAGSASGAAEVAPAPAPAPPKVVGLTPEVFAPEGEESAPQTIFAIEGALVVARAPKFGRIVGEKIEWFGSVSHGGGMMPERAVWLVAGRYPDEVDVVTAVSNGRVLTPTYQPLTGKGTPHSAGNGDTYAWFYGLGRVGESTVAATFNETGGERLVTVRGSERPLEHTSQKDAGCKPGEVETPEYRPPGPAISPRAFEGTPSGKAVSIGMLCQHRSAAAEIWDASGKAEIVDLSKWWKQVAMRATLLRGNGDELWAHGGVTNTVILHYVNGAFEALPALEKPIEHLFLSEAKVPHVSDGEAVFRFEGGQWVKIAEFAWKATVERMVLEKGALWAADDGKVIRLREGPRAEWSDECKTPFVFLYDVRKDNDSSFTFPGTRKALATFPDVLDLTMVELNALGGRRLGLVVKSKAQGEAVMAHVVANMKNEHPKLMCLEPKSYRKIQLDKKK